MFGERLKLARKRAGLSLRGVSERLEGKLSAQALGKYERGEMKPSSRVLLDIAKTLNMPLNYFMTPLQVELGAVDFRKKANTSEKDRARVEAEVLQHIERYLQVEQILGLDSRSWRNPLRANGYTLKNLEEAETAADALRGCWELGNDPILNLTQLLEDYGLKVLMLNLPERVHGLTCFVHTAADDQQSFPVVVVNRGDTLERRRYTLAHELGHCVLDPSSEVDFEKAANRFAGAFLVSSDHLQLEVGDRRTALSYEEILQLKRLYRVSAAMLLVRARDCRIIAPETLTYAFKTFARGWRTQEPAPLEAEPAPHQERPHRFERLCYRALSEGYISLAKASELLHRPVRDIENAIKGPVPA